MKTYKAYLFKDKDPVIDQVRTLIQKEYNGTGKKGDRDAAIKEAMRNVEKGGGPQRGTLRGWFYGDVKRPHSATIEAAGRSLGYQRVWEKMK